MTIEALFGIIILCGVLAGIFCGFKSIYTLEGIDYGLIATFGFIGIILLVYGFSPSAKIRQVERELNLINEKIAEVKNDCNKLSYTEDQCNETFIYHLNFEREMALKQLKDFIIKKYEN